MKKNEIIELNGVEYTLELNRESFLAIDRVCNIQKSFNILFRGLYEYVEEVDDNYDPFANLPSDEEIQKEVDLKDKTLKNLVERAFHVWLYPNHKLSITEVREIIKPYLEDEEKAKFIGERTRQYIDECIAITSSYNEERKNLKALTNKK